jgi:hypothetical protein
LTNAGPYTPILLSTVPNPRNPAGTCDDVAAVVLLFDGLADGLFESSSSAIDSPFGS